MKTMKTIIAVASLAIGFGLAACDDSELIAPNNMTSGSATKQTLDLDTTAVGGSGQTPVITNGGKKRRIVAVCPGKGFFI